MMLWKVVWTGNFHWRYCARRCYFILPKEFYKSILHRWDGWNKTLERKKKMSEWATIHSFLYTKNLKPNEINIRHCWAWNVTTVLEWWRSWPHRWMRHHIHVCYCLLEHFSMNVGLNNPHMLGFLHIAQFYANKMSIFMGLGCSVYKFFKIPACWLTPQLQK